MQVSRVTSKVVADDATSGLIPCSKCQYIVAGFSCVHFIVPRLPVPPPLYVNPTQYLFIPPLCRAQENSRGSLRALSALRALAWHAACMHSIIVTYMRALACAKLSLACT